VLKPDPTLASVAPRATGAENGRKNAGLIALELARPPG
jgi:hypothetical protein